MKRTVPTGSPRVTEKRQKSTLDDRDKKSIVRLLKDAGIASYEPRVVNLLVHRMQRYVSEIVTDARAYADHAGRLDIRMKDVRLASQKRQDALTPGILIRQDIIQQAEEVNQIPLPAIPDDFGVHIHLPAQAGYPTVGSNGSSIKVDSSSSKGKEGKRKMNNKHPLSGNVDANNMAREVPSSSPSHKTELYSSSIPLAGAVAHVGKTGKKRKKKATDNLTNGDADESLSVRPTRVSPVVNGHSRHAHVKDHRLGRTLPSPDNLPAGAERPRANTLNLACQAKKTAAELDMMTRESRC